MKLLKILGILVLLFVVAVLGFYFWALRTATTKYEKQWTAHNAEFPVPFPLDSSEVAALRAPGAKPANGPTDAELQAAARDKAIRNGKRLLDSRLGCLGCHNRDLGGLALIDAPMLGYWAAPNLTSGRGSVTNGFSAHDWDLAVRHGIRHTGQSSSMPSNEFVRLADHDLSDVVDYIRSRPPVDRLIGPVRLGPIFVVLTATDPNSLPAFAIDHERAHRVEPPPQTVGTELGDYLLDNCRGCHNSKLSGGKMQGDPNMPIVANLTPDPTGIKGWTQADFFRAIREGKRPNGTSIAAAMPWSTYRNMNDVELASIWAYLETVPALPKGAH